MPDQVPQGPPVVAPDLSTGAGVIEDRPYQAPLPATNFPLFSGGGTDNDPNAGRPQTIAQLFNSVRTPSDEKSYLSPEYTPQPLTKRYANWNPYIDNEEVAAQKQPWYDKWANALLKTGATAIGTFAQSLMTIPDSIRAIGSGDLSADYQSPLENGVDTWMKNLEDEFPNYYTKWEQLHPFESAIPFSGGAANFWSDKFVKNLGFTVGAIGGALFQDTIVGGVTEGLGEIPMIGGQIGKAALWLNKVFSTETKLGEALGATSAGRLSTLMGTAEKAGASGQALLDMKELAQMAATKKITDGVRYAMNLYGAARTEGGFEARDGFNTVRQDLIDQFKATNHRDPSSDETGEMEKYATAGANVRFGVNLALLTISDAIQFDNVLKPFSAAKKGVTGTIQKELEEGAAKIAVKEGTVDTFEKEVPKTTRGRIWNAVKPSIPNILSEGIYEEGGQYAAQVATQNYYEDKHNKKIKGTLDDAINSTLKGLHDEFGTTEGLENVVIGGLTGVLTGVAEHLWDKYKGHSENALNTSLSLINNNGVLGLIQNLYGNAAKSSGTLERMQAAAKGNDLFQYNNEKSHLFTNFVLSHLQADRFEVAMEKLNIAKELPQEQFEKAFGIEKTSESKKTVDQYIDALKERANAVKNNYDTINEVFSNPYRLNRRPKTEEQAVEASKYAKFEEWKASLLEHTSDIDDTNRRLASIGGKVSRIGQGVDTQLVQRLTHPEQLKATMVDYNSRAADIQKDIDERLSPQKDMKDEVLLKNNLTKHASAIEEYLKNPEDQKFLKLFDGLLHFNLNQETEPKNGVEVKKQNLPSLIRYGVDANRLDTRKTIAQKAYDVLTSEKGFNGYFANLASKDGSIEDAFPGKPVDVNAEELKVPVTTKGGTEATFEGGKSYLLDTGKKGEPNIQNLIYTGTTEEGNLNFTNEAGEAVTYNPKELTVLEKHAEQVADSFKTISTSIESGGPVISDVVPSEGDKKKDIITGVRATTDPKFEETAPFNNFHRRHQTFLFNLGSTDPRIFNQEVKPFLKIMPVTEKTAGQLGLPREFAQNKEGEEATIRAVYISQRGNVVSLLDHNGKEIGEVGDSRSIKDPNKFIFTTLPDTSLKYQNDNRYTNKSNLDEGKVQQWQKDFREGLLSKDFDSMPLFNFQVSRGFPNIINQDTRNTVKSVGLITEKDLNKLIITIPTLGDTTIAALINDEGEGVAADSNGVNMPLGVPLLNHGGNLVYLNNRKLTSKEASNIHELITELARLAQEARGRGEHGALDQAIMKYLSRVMYLSSPEEGKTPTANQTWVAKDGMHFGPSLSVPFFTNTITASKAAIISFLENSFHNVNNYELNRVTKERLQDISFNELEMKEGKVIASKTWPTYTHYLLTSDNAPLTTNIAKPQGDEIPIIQKYSVLQQTGFDNKTLQKEQKEAPKAALSTVVKPVATTQAAASEIETEFLQPDGRRIIYSQILSAEGNVVDVRIIKGVMPNGKDTLIPEDKIPIVRNILRQALGLQAETPQQAIAPTPAETKKHEAGSALDKLKGHQAKPTDTQFKAAYVIPSSYEQGDIEAEFAKAKAFLPDYVQFKQTKNLLRMTGGGLAWGAMRDASIYVYKNAIAGTTYHEAFELVWQNFLEPKDQVKMFKEFTSREGTFSTYQGESKSFSQANFKEAKEQIADEFAKYVQDGKNPVGSQQKSWFKKVVDFIKKLFLGSSRDLISLFRDIEEGYYRNYPASQRNINSTEYSNIKASEAFVQDVLQGMTADLFSREFEKDSAIVTQFEENPKTAAATIYGRLYNSMQYFFTSDDPNATDTLQAIYADKMAEAKNAGEQAQIAQEFEAIQKHWEFIKGNWDAFVGEHIQYLKVFKIEFSVSDDGEIHMDDASKRDLENYESMVGQSEYARDMMTINAKNAASEKVKLLLATIADREFLKQSVGSTLRTLQGINTRIKRENSQVRMPKLVSYAKTFNYVLHNVSNINGIYDIYKKLTLMAGNTRIKTNAVVDALVTRLNFKSGFKGKSIDQAKLILSTEGAFSKQKPDFVRQYVDDQGHVYFKTSIVNSRVDQVVDNWISDMKSSGVVQVTRDGGFLFGSSIKGEKDPITFLASMGIQIPKEDHDELTTNDKTKFKDEVGKLKAALEANIGKSQPIFTGKQLGIDSRLSNLAALYVDKIVGDDTESMHFNLDGEMTANFVLPNYAATILNDANNSKTRDEFIAKNPQFNDIFHADSILLNDILYGADGKFTSPINIAIVEGRESFDSNGNKSASSLTEAERYIYEINNNLQGIFYTLLPADAKTEWAIYTGQYIKASEYFDQVTKDIAVGRFTDRMWSNLQTEVKLAEDFSTNPNRSNITELNKVVGSKKKGEALRFFADILPRTMLDTIYSGDQVDRGEFNKVMTDWVAEKAEASFKYLNDKNIFAVSNLGNYKLNGLLTEFTNRHIGAKRDYYSKEEALNLLTFREMNYAINNIEMHKFFFGDPAQYSDEMKRIKSFLSGREWTHVDTVGTAEGFNQWANSELNKGLVEGDPGYHTFANFMTALTARDINVHSSSLEMLKEMLGKDSKPYSEINEADAQTWQMATSYRETLLKAAGRWTQQMEDQFQYEMAYERDVKLRKGTYDYSSAALQLADKETLKRGSDPKAYFYITKPIHSGIQALGNTAIISLDKTSAVPLFYRFVEGTQLEHLYNAMQENGHDYIRVESAHKVGIQVDSTISLYNKDGSINVEGINNSSYEEIPYKYYGIQVDTSSRKEAQTEGSQFRKQAVGDLMNAGVPVDYKEGKAKWDALSDAEKKATSPIHNLVQQHEDALSAMVNKRYNNLLNKLGVKEKEGGFEYKSVKKVSDFILREITRRELPNNIRDSIQVDPENPSQFKVPLEALSNYQQVRSILWSTIEKNIVRPKVSGGMKIQLTATGWEKAHRVQVSNVNGKQVMTSSELKFYNVGKDGKTEKCEVYIPYWFGNQVKSTLAKNGTSFSIDKAFKDHILNYLNSTEEGKKLLSGIGFRIPTQRDNSIESFIVKDFLPEQMGDAIIFPSEITAKAGSDFDVDKMNTYLRNFYMDEKGYPHVVPFEKIDTSDEASLKEYYNRYMIEGRREYMKWEGEQSGNKLLSDILKQDVTDEEPEYTPSLEEFLEGAKGKSAFEVNSLEALENKYFDILEDIYSLPEKLKGMVDPNNADQMKEISLKISKLKDPNYNETKQPFGRVLDSLWMMKERHKYLVGKKGVGVAAVGQSNLNVNQLAGVYLKLPAKVQIRLPHNTVEVDGAKFVSLSSIENQGEDSISKINSMFIDGFVDIAKGAWIIDMGANDEEVKNFLVQAKWGTDPWDTALFMNQPAIQMYIQEKANRKSVSQINKQYKVKTAPQLYGIVNSMFKPGFGKKQLDLRKPNMYTTSQMEEMMRKFGKGEPLTIEENRLQMQVLSDYQAYDKLSWDNFRFFQGYNWDTGRVNDPNVTRKKVLQYNAAQQGPISSLEGVMKGFIGAVKDKVIAADHALRSLFQIQTGEGDVLMTKLVTDLSKRRGLTQEAFRKAMFKGETSTLEYTYQTTGKYKGATLNKWLPNILMGTNSAAHYLKALQESGDQKLTNNPLIKNLRANIDEREGRPSNIELIEKDYDSYTSNVWTDAFRELKDDNKIIKLSDNPNNDRSVSQIADKIVLAGILQSGLKRSAISYTHLIPNEMYSNVVKDALINIKSDLPGFYRDNVFYRMNWEDNDIVPRVPPTIEETFTEFGIETQKVYPGFNSHGVNQILKDEGVVNLPSTLRLSAFDYQDKKVVKTVDYKRDPRTKQIIERVVKLFQRVDTWTREGVGPLIASRVELLPGEFEESKVNYAVFKEINKWGAGTKAQEYYDDNLKSIMADNPFVEEVDDDLLTYAIGSNGYTTNQDESDIGYVRDIGGDVAVQGDSEADTEPDDGESHTIEPTDEEVRENQKSQQDKEIDDTLGEKDNGCKE